MFVKEKIVLQEGKSFHNQATTYIKISVLLNKNLIHPDTDPDPQHCWIRRKEPSVGRDLQLLEVVDGLSDGPVYLLYLGEGGAGADPAARRRQRPLVIIVLLLVTRVTQLKLLRFALGVVIFCCNIRGSKLRVSILKQKTRNRKKKFSIPV